MDLQIGDSFEDSLDTSVENKATSIKKDLSAMKIFVCGLCGFVCNTRKWLKIHTNLCEKSVKNSSDKNLKSELSNESASMQSLDEQSPLEPMCEVKIEMDIAETSICKPASPTAQQPSETTGEPTQLTDDVKHKGKKTYKCDTCQYTTWQPRFLKAHKRKHARNKKLLKVYMRKLSGEKAFKCTECDRSYTTHCAFAKHLKTHAVEKSYKCELCDYATTLVRNLTKHTLAKHTLTEQTEDNSSEYITSLSFVGNMFKCTTCESYYESHRDLTKHMRTHTGKKIFKCTICDYQVAHSGSFKVHIRTHTGEKPFQCPKCDYSCVKRANLTVHVRTHTGEKPFRCRFCKYASAQASVLKLHLRTHTGEKPYNCAVCDYASSQMCQLKNHMRIHTGEKPYGCTVCEYASTQRSTLKRHMKVHEKVE